jgi:hypothetical protein
MASKSYPDTSSESESVEAGINLQEYIWESQLRVTEMLIKVDELMEQLAEYKKKEAKKRVTIYKVTSATGEVTYHCTRCELEVYQCNC